MSMGMGYVSQRNSRRRATVLVYSMFATIALLAIVSLAVDFGRMQLAKTELQSATDAAARYGVKGLSSGTASVKSLVVTAGSENKVNGAGLVIDPTADIEFGEWDPTTKTFTVLTGAAQSSATAIRVTGRLMASRGTAVPLVFGSVFGQTTCDIKSVCVAATSATANDVFLIQDITTSFKEELPDAKIGDQGLLDRMYSFSAPKSRLAIAVHTGWGTTLAPLTEISTNYSYLTSRITSIKVAGSTGMPVASGTDIASGFDEAITAYTAAGYTPPPGTKNVVLVSDGSPTSDSSGKHPTLNDSQLLALAQTRANTLWSKGVNIYVVFMDSSNDATGAANVKTLMRGSGTFIHVTDPKLLPAALKDMTDKILTATIVQ
jgi:hypothetical protein